MTAGAITTRGLVFKTYVISLFSLLTPIIITLALQRTAVADAMLALVLIYVAFMLVVAKNYSFTVSRNIQLWLDNEKLVEQLIKSHSKAEDANLELMQEIERRKQIESELVEAKERSEQANQAKNYFLANVSHELRTPLNGIMGFAELLQQEKMERKHQEHISQIDKAARTLLHIVNDILDITAIEAGHISFYEEPFSLRNEMEEVVSILQPLAERKKLKLQLRVGEDAEDGLCGDANRLRQIVSNLLSNALKYTEAGQIIFSISQQSVREGKVILRFEVEDTGIGIAKEELDSVFENFTRLENFETRRGEGTGLGLAIVKSLVQKMDGRLAVRSTPGIGSCFSFEMPFALSNVVYTKVPRAKASGLAAQQWRAFKVLVVDDNDINRRVLTTFLGKRRIPYEEAANGHQAMERIRGEDFDVVLLDIQMPDISGIDVAKRLYRERSSVPTLIAVTAHAFPEQRQAILDAGFTDFLVKPIDMVDLEQCLIRAYMERYGKQELSKQQLLL
jgi:signal transduction histidine kinase/ActR/RegA family two-component response regulator